MSKVAIISDLHFGARRNNIHFLISTLNFFNNDLKPQLIERGIKDIIILGDIYDNREATNVRVANAVYHLFEDDLKDFNITSIIGNHDIFYRNATDIHALKFMSKLNNVKIIDSISVCTFDNLNVLMVPWQIDQENFFKNLDSMNLSGINVCMGHFDIKNFSLNPFVISQEGFDGGEFAKRFVKTFSGHYHTRSTQMFDNREILYVGSPYHLDRSDADTERGFHIFDTDTFDVEFVPCNSTIKYKKFQYPCIIDIDEINNNIIDLHVKIDNEYDESEFNEFVREIEEFKPLSVNFFPVYSFDDDNTSDDNVKGKTIEEMIGEWIDRNFTFTDDVSPELSSELQTYVLKLMTQVKNASV